MIRGLEPSPPDTPESRQAPSTVSTTQGLPDDVLIIVPVRNLVLFPGVISPLIMGREASLAAVEEASRSGRKLGFILQHSAETDAPQGHELHRVGTIARMLRQVKSPDGQRQIVVQGEQRFRVLDYLPGFPFMLARIEILPDIEVQSPALEAQSHVLRQQATAALGLLPQAPAELGQALQAAKRGGNLADLVAGVLDIPVADKQALLEITDVSRRLEQVTQQLSRRVEVLKLSRKIDQETQQSLNERQREAVLREQMRSIQKELGEGDHDSELEALRQRLDQAGLPEEAEEQARKELRRLQRMPEASPEHGMIRNYLDWMLDLPWGKLDAEDIQISHSREVLDADHYGLDKVKKRILEYLAVRKLNPEGRSPILCFVGPPGVGKTSLGRSIARALGLEFVRASLGGLHDEAEIRGHRRTYIGSLPGTIIQSLRRAGTRNPVFMLDEMDKLGAGGFHGDPASALLEVLDPEQNNSFRDNYLGVSFDLSKVLFIATANVLENIPGPLRDRMEVIELPGYTEEEKIQIARRYLVDRQREVNGLKDYPLELPESTLQRLVQDYTREAGCRNLERTIGGVLRHLAVRVSEGEAQLPVVQPEDLHDILGPRKFESEVALRTSVPGVATGLAWTPVGGDILFIETTRTPGSGKLIITGQLGEVMRESAQAALTLLKARGEELGITENFAQQDIHLHVPAGAIPKDGPSAGVAMFVSLVSLFSGRRVNSEIAMTGEISLRGLVLPVGGIKEKCLAALRAGIHTVMLPARNRKDLEEIPASAREQLRFIWLEDVQQALEAVLAPEHAAQ